MNMRDLGATLRRRWQLALAGVLATIGMCVVTFLVVPATYEAKANVVLLPPKSSVGVGGNPYLQLGGLDQVVDVVSRALNSQQAVDEVSALAPGATYEVAQDFATSGPILVVTADDRTPDRTLAALKVVVDKVVPALQNLQVALGVSASAQITSAVITSDDRATTVRKTQIRALVVAAAAGVVLSAVVIALVDSLLLRRRCHATDDVAEPSTMGARHSAETGGSDSGTPGTPAALRAGEVVTGFAEGTRPATGELGAAGSGGASEADRRSVGRGRRRRRADREAAAHEPVAPSALRLDQPAGTRRQR